MCRILSIEHYMSPMIANIRASRLAMSEEVSQCALVPGGLEELRAPRAKPAEIVHLAAARAWRHPVFGGPQ